MTDKHHIKANNSQPSINDKMLDLSTEAFEKINKMKRQKLENFNKLLSWNPNNSDFLSYSCYKCDFKN
jgi:hypothetical protein